MTSLRTRARRALLDLVTRTVTGERIPPEDEPWIDSELALSGFRRTALGYLVRRSARGALRQGDVTIVCRALDGLFTIACSATDLGVGWAILETGTYEPHVVDLYRRLLKPGMTVADVGANIGFHALHAAALVGPEGKVYAVEPDARSASLLRLSISLNEGRFPIELIEAALSDAPGELIHTDLGNAGNSGARFTHDDRSRLAGLVHGLAPRFRTVRAIRWDEAFLETPLSFVKIDIEGFEPRALRGMERSVERYRPIILTEFAPSNLRDLGDVEPSAYLAWFSERGYRGWIVEGPGGGAERGAGAASGAAGGAGGGAAPGTVASGVPEGSTPRPSTGKPGMGKPSRPFDGLPPAGEAEIERALRGKHHVDIVFEPDSR